MMVVEFGRQRDAEPRDRYPSHFATLLVHACKKRALD